MVLLCEDGPVLFKTLCSVLVLRLPPEELPPSPEMAQPSDRVCQGLRGWFKWQ